MVLETSEILVYVLGALFFVLNRWKLYRDSISKERSQVDLHILSSDLVGGQDGRPIGLERESE